MNNIYRLSLLDVEHLFESIPEADKEAFADTFWTNFAECTYSASMSLQIVVHHLEAYKRHLGRRANHACDKVSKNYIICQYNAVEYTIAYLVSTYNLQRTSKPYTMEIQS